MMLYTLLVLSVVKIIALESHVIATPLHDYPCVGSTIIVTKWYEKILKEKTEYSVFIKKYLPAKTVIRVKFDSEATIKLNNNSTISSKLSKRNKNDTFSFETLAAVDFLIINVSGSASGNIPYFKSLMINFREYCENPSVGYLEKYLLDDKETKQVRIKRDGKKKKKKKIKKTKKTVENVTCGRRKHLDYTELIINGATSKAGDWPWHAAIYRRNKSKKSYICGGTLVSKFYILTAAHCVTIYKVPVAPDILSVVLGKYNFIEHDSSCQEINVYAVKVHEDFGWPKYLDNDIAILQLSAEAVYNNYVQPACIWYKKAKHKLPTDEIFGTVAGWGIKSRARDLAPQLRQITMPKIKHSDCIKKNPHFYGVMLKNERKFCAGWGNGTSPCNGDSGGGFMVFVPDRVKDHSSTAGAWYIRGIVSLAVSFKDEAVCDPNQHVVFTNILKYKDWIKNHT